MNNLVYLRTAKKYSNLLKLVTLCVNNESRCYLLFQHLTFTMTHINDIINSHVHNNSIKYINTLIKHMKTLIKHMKRKIYF